MDRSNCKGLRACFAGVLPVNRALSLVLDIAAHPVVQLSDQ